MATGIDLLEHVFQQLHDAGLVSSKAEFSERLLGKSRSYLTSMRARNRHVSNDAIMALDVALRTEIRARNKDQDVADRIVLRRALAEIADFLGNYPLVVLLKGTGTICSPTQAKGSFLIKRNAGRLA